jgi:membrane-associated protease RseP (regulator of RpoE activity)
MYEMPLYHLTALPDLSRIGSIVMMLVFISVLIIAHEMGHFYVARRCGIKVERFGFGLPFGPTLWSRKIGDVEYCIHACLFGGYVSFPDDDPDNPLPKDAPERFENQPLPARFAVMIAGVTVNAILGWIIMFSVFMAWGHPTGEAERKVLIGGLQGQSAPAARAGFLKGDEIRRVNGVAVQGNDYVAMVTHVKTLMQENSRHAVPVEVLRNGRPLTLTVTPSAEGRIGVQLAAAQKFEPVNGPLDGAVKTSTFLGDVIAKQFDAFGKLFSGRMDIRELAGPIRIVDEGANLINTNGIQTGLMLTAIISIILAVMNLLPIPALDGGHIFFLLIEALKGSPIKQEFRERVTQAGFLGLLGLIAFILLNDINNTFINPIK